MPDTRHVDTDLVGPSCLQAAADLCVSVVPCQHFPVGHGGTPGSLHNGHALAVCRMPADGSIDDPALLPEAAADHGFIHAGEAPIRKLRRQRLVSEIVFRNNQEAGCIFVDAVNDPGAFFSADTGEAVPAMPEEGVDQGPIGMPGRRMDHHAPRLIDNDEVVILKINVIDDDTEEYASIEDEELLEKLFEIFKSKYEGDIDFA